jgi:integrase
VPRRPKPAWAPIPRREWRTGSLSRDRTSGTIRARLPKELDPKRSSRKFRPDDLAGATAWLDGEVARLRRGDAHSGETRLVDWCDHWCATAVEPFGVHNTTRAYDQALRKLAPIWDRPLEEVRTSDLQACVAGMAGLSAKTIRDTVAVWRRCFDRAVDDGLVARNPVRRLTLPRTEQPAEPRAVWTAEETARLWVAIVGHRFGAVYALVLGCGIRLGEALGLHWDDVDLDGRRAYVRRQWTECRWREAPKGKNPHWIALPAPVALALARHRATWPAVACGHTAHKHPEDGAPLVAGNPATGRPWSGAVVRRALAELATAHGIPVRSPHAGRHGVATALLADGVAPAVVASILGHANSATTLSVYDHATAEGADRARELMERRLDAPLGTILGTGE